MSVNFKGGNRKQQYLFPPSVEDWLPANHLARFVVEIVGLLDISSIISKYGDRGSKAYDPAMMIAFLFYGYASKLEIQLEQEINELPQKAEQTDSADLPDGMGIPEEISRRDERLEAIRKAKAEIESRAAEHNAEENKAYIEKIAKRAAKGKKTGKKPPGKRSQPPSVGPSNKDQVNLTDVESRIMLVSGGGFDQCYNAQARVDAASQLIVCSSVSQKPNDKKDVKPAIQELQSLNPCLGAVTAL